MPDEPAAIDVPAPTHLSRPVFRLRRAGRWCYRQLVDLGPVAVLLSILLTNWQSCRAYSLNRDSARPQLFVRDFVTASSPGEPMRLLLVLDNAGMRPARLLAHKWDASFIPIDQTPRTMDLPDERSRPVNMVIPQNQPKMIRYPVTFEATDGSPPLETKPQLLEYLRQRREQLVTYGEVHYRDDYGDYWMPFCETLAPPFEWQNCPAEGTSP